MSREDTRKIIEESKALLAEPMTLRQLFYQLVSRGYPKTEAFYHKLGRVIGKARDDEIIGWDRIVDSSRMIIEPLVFDSVKQWRDACIRSLKFPIWVSAPVVFIEKRALMGIISPLLYQYRVNGVAISGYCSKTILNDYRDHEVIYLGDWDADGMCISDSAKKYCQNLTRIALNEEQIAEYDLPTRPQKATSSRAGKWGSEAVELDALPNSILIQLLQTELENRIDKSYRAEVLQQEKEIRHAESGVS